MRLNLCGGIIGRGLQLFTVMQLVLLAGELGEKYGQRHEYWNLRTPADAIKLLCFNYPELKQELFQAHHNGVGYKVIQGGASIGYDELHLPFGSKPLLVVPVISGAGGSTGQILLGVGLVAASFLLPGAGLFGATSIFGASATTAAFVSPLTGIAYGSAVAAGAGIGTALSAVGAGLILKGTANLISPQPELPNASANRISGEGTNVRGPGPEGITRGGMGQQSYAFTGPANTAGTGATLPVIYGQVITGSHLIAANVEVVDDSDPLKLATQKPRVGSTRINGDKLTRKLKDCGGIESMRGLRRLDSDDGDSRKRRIVNKTFGPSGDQQLEEEANIEIEDRDDTIKYKKESEFRQALDVIFSIKNGLYDYAGAPGTTKIDGFIKYEVAFKADSTTLAKAAITLQGLVNDTQDFIYLNRFEMPKAKSLDNKKLKMKVTILDSSVHETVTFKIQSYGYNLHEKLSK